MSVSNNSGVNGFPIPIGMMMMWAGNAAADVTLASGGYLKCDGTTYSTADYPDLFNEIGYTYGGSGGSFQVPTLDGTDASNPYGFVLGDDVAGTIVPDDLNTSLLTAAAISLYSNNLPAFPVDYTASSFTGKAFFSNPTGTPQNGYSDNIYNDRQPDQKDYYPKDSTFTFNDIIGQSALRQWAVPGLNYTNPSATSGGAGIDVLPSVTLDAVPVAQTTNIQWIIKAQYMF